MNSPSATLPAPKVPAARDGGLGYDDLKNRNGYTYVDVGPLLDAMGGETVSVSLNGALVATHTVTSDDLVAGAFPVAVSNAKFVDAGDGIHTLTYTLVYEEGEGEELSAPTDVLVKRSVPGGLDPSPGTPEFNENLKVAFVEPSPVPADAVSVSIDVELWINAAVGDVMTVSWHGALFDSSPLETPFPTRFGLSLTAAQVLDAGVGPAIPVTWGVIDVAGNWSGWAKETVVDVRIEDPGLFEAPHVGDKDQAWTEIDLATLGTADLTVFTPEYAGAVKGDSVIVHTHGASLGGDAVTFDSVPQAMTGDGFGLTFSVPNATVQALAASNLRAWYSVSGKGDSKSVWLPVRGEAQGGLPAPVVTEAVDSNGDGTVDRLDPDHAKPSAHVVIDYPAMALYDSVVLLLVGTTGSGAPVQVTFDRQIGVVGPTTVLVNQTDVVKFLDGKMDVYYRVEPYGKRRAIVRAVLSKESDHLPLRVRRGSAEQPLPAPTVDELVDGLLDPAAEQATLRAPLYPGIARGDEITYSWVGTASTRKQTYKVSDPARTPSDYAGREFIEANTGSEVIVSYTVKHGGTEPAVSSDTIKFRIDVTAPFYIDHSPVSLSGLQTYTRNAFGGVPPYKYESSKPGIVEVTAPNSGAIKGKANGNAIITAQDSAQGVGTYSVTVTGIRPFPEDITEFTNFEWNEWERGPAKSSPVADIHLEQGNYRYRNGTLPGTNAGVVLKKNYRFNVGKTYAITFGIVNLQPVVSPVLRPPIISIRVDNLVVIAPTQIDPGPWLTVTGTFIATAQNAAVKFVSHENDHNGNDYDIDNIVVKQLD
jgi:hypothetical protein